MEISLQAPNSLKIKGKKAIISVNPQDKSMTANLAILLGNPAKSSLKIPAEVVVIDGPGEYEAAGVKIAGMKADDQTIYTLTLDGVDILMGTRQALEKHHQKLKEHNVSLIYASVEGDASFATGLSANALIFFGEQAKTVADQLAKDEKKQTTKYVITAEKLPSETETVLLA
jgi:hypothetical protein